jgi:hypothetical protein
MRVSASTPVIFGFFPQPCRGIHCRAVGRKNLASLYVLDAAQDRQRLIEVLVAGP